MNRKKKRNGSIIFVIYKCHLSEQDFLILNF